MTLLSNEVKEIRGSADVPFEVRVQVEEDGTLGISVEADKGQPGEVVAVACLAMLKNHLAAMGVPYRELKRRSGHESEDYTDALLLRGCAERATEFIALLQFIANPKPGGRP